MDFYSDSNQTPNRNQISANTPNGFSIAAVICGVLSLICCCTGVLAIPVGALGIIFAVLTRRKGSGMPLMSTIGIWLCCVGMALGILLIWKERIPFTGLSVAVLFINVGFALFGKNQGKYQRDQRAARSF